MTERISPFVALRTVILLRAAVLMMWPVTTYAASQSLGSTLSAVGTSDWISLVMLSGVSGLVALLHRVRRILERTAMVQQGLAPSDATDIRLIPWWYFGICHMSGALLVGFMSFLICEAAGSFVTNYLEAATIALTSWGGAKFADAWADKAGDGMGRLIDTVFGKSSSSK